eukprot:6109829-Alexandrium_andersonii.AAC.1
MLVARIGFAISRRSRQRRSFAAAALPLLPRPVAAGRISRPFPPRFGRATGRSPRSSAPQGGSNAECSCGVRAVVALGRVGVVVE